jgi:hypothetical protein
MTRYTRRTIFTLGPAAIAALAAAVAETGANHGVAPHKTFTPTNTPAVPTDTPVPPTATNTPLPPTATFTPTNTPIPPTPTFTPVPPTATNTPPPVSCPNLILNESFEVAAGAGAANWVRGVRDTTVARTGAASLKNNWQGDLYARTDPFVTLQPNTQYILSGWVKTENILGTEPGAGLRYVVTAPAMIVHPTTYIKGTNDWTFLSVTFTTAANYVDGRVDLHMVSAAGMAWWEDVDIHATVCAMPTDTPVPTNTNTPVPPTDTPTNTPTDTPTNTPTNTPTQTPNGWVDLGAVSQIAAVSTAVGRVINCIEPFGGRMFLGYGDYGANQPSTCQLMSYVPGSGYVDHGEADTHATFGLRNLGTQLACPFIDPNDIQNDSTPYDDCVFVHSDFSVETIWGASNQVQPNGVHYMDTAIFGGERYICGASYPSGGGDQQAIWRETASGWVFDFQGDITAFLDRVYGIFVLNNNLYAAMSNDQGTGGNGNRILRRVGANNWTHVTTGPNVMKRVRVAGSEAWFCTGTPGVATSGLWKFNGSVRTNVVSSGVWDHTVGDDGALYYLNSAGQIKNAAGTTVVATTPANARSLARFGGFWYIGTSDSHLWRMS